MRKLILLVHASLDGFVAGLDGEMDWITFDEELSDYVSKITDDADAVMYGRITYQMMESYWPTAAESPTASKHDIDHAHWVNKALKIVFSKTLQKTDWANTRIINDINAQEISTMKTKPGQNILLIGSPSIAHALMQADLIDEYWININPVVLGEGIPLFKDISTKMNLRLVQSKSFGSGVLGLHYEVERN